MRSALWHEMRQPHTCACRKLFDGKEGGGDGSRCSCCICDARTLEAEKEGVRICACVRRGTCAFIYIHIYL